MYHILMYYLIFHEALSILSNFNGSNTFGTMKFSSRQGKFELMSVDYSARSDSIIGIIFWIFFSMKARCVFSVESPQRGDSNEFTQHAIIHI